MDFDTIITIGVIIYFIYSIKKALSANKNGKDGQKQKSAGWAGKLGDFVNNIKDEIEKANQETMAGQSPDNKQEDQDNSFWEDIREPAENKNSATEQSKPNYENKNSAKKQSKPNYENKNLVKGQSKLNCENKPETNMNIMQDPNQSHRNIHEISDTANFVYKKRKKASHCLNIKKTDLKKVIIWSEIISKPIALRK